MVTKDHVYAQLHPLPSKGLFLAALQTLHNRYMVDATGTHVRMSQLLASYLLEQNAPIMPPQQMRLTSADTENTSSPQDSDTDSRSHVPFQLLKPALQYAHGFLNNRLPDIYSKRANALV